MRGPLGTYLFLTMRLLTDQARENATGDGSPPWTWPIDEQVAGLAHKVVCAVVTGAVADQFASALDATRGGTGDDTARRTRTDHGGVGERELCGPSVTARRHPDQARGIETLSR